MVWVCRQLLTASESHLHLGILRVNKVHGQTTKPAEHLWGDQVRHPSDDAACKARAVPFFLLATWGQIQGDSLFDECLERPFIDFLAIMNVDRTTGVTFEAGVKQA